MRTANAKKFPAESEKGSVGNLCLMKRAEKNNFKKSPEKSENVLFGNLDQIERRGSCSERKVLQMQKETIDQAACLDAEDEDLIDTLTAISVVAKRLAVKIRNEATKEGEKQDGKNE